MGFKPKADYTIVKDGNRTTYTISGYNRDGSITKLSHLIQKLPRGIFDKTITGLGGTTLELDTVRPSIIVEPLNITAYNKSKLPSIKRQYKIFYYGTRKKNSSKRDGKSIHIQGALREYLLECKQQNVPPKIICITDQIFKLKSEFDSITTYNFSDFHLLLDEIDYMQEQIEYRKSMETCVEIYKAHNKQRRTLLSATINYFHDPELKDEPYTKIEVIDLQKTPTSLIVGRNHPKQITSWVMKLQEHNPRDKFLIALNSLPGIQLTISELIYAGVEKEDIAMMSSERNEKEYSEFFMRINEDGILPKRINFITAAYFNGFDVLEPAHVIMCISAAAIQTRLSAKTLYQIHGRVRPGVLSNVIIGEFRRKTEPYITEGYIDEALELFQETTSLHNKYLESKNPFIKRYADVIQNIYVNGHDGLKSIWTYKRGKLEYSHLKIDSLLEDERTRRTLETPERFIDDAKQFFEFTSITVNEEEPENKVLLDVSQLLEFSQQYEGINLEDPMVLNKLSIDMDSAAQREQRQILMMLIRVARSSVFNKPSIFSALKAVLSSSKWKTELGYLERHVQYHSVITGGNHEYEHKHLLFNSFAHVRSIPASVLREKSSLFLKTLMKINETKSKEFVAVSRAFNTELSFQNSLLKIEKTRSRKHDKVTVVSFDLFGILNLTDYPELDIKKSSSDPLTGSHSKNRTNNTGKKKDKKSMMPGGSIDELVDSLPIQSRDLRTAVIKALREQGIDDVDDLKNL